ncbi:MAG TPA: TetR/AcrR family transcriptional regulator [Solirubrobacteraceae bacterium]|nr:TetR/AcrR family transcriptional regulator [Solirubrobacteraceae bacterium]
MAVSNARSKPPPEEPASGASRGASPSEQAAGSGSSRRKHERYRRLPTGAHGLAPEVVEHDQRERLQSALIELIAQKGYPGVRIIDLTQLARVSQPTFYSLYKDKEELFIAAYDRVADRTARTVLATYDGHEPGRQRLGAGLRAFADLAAAEPQEMSLFLLGAFGAGPAVLEHRRRRVEQLESHIRASRDRAAPAPGPDLTVKFVIGGIREVTASRLSEGHAERLPALADELARWAGSYPSHPPAKLTSRPRRRASGKARTLASERARRAQGRLPSGRSDMPKQLIAKSQRERIVDATAAIVAEKGLAKLTIPEIARRANVSHQTFYEMYPSKHDAFLGAQKVGMHQALHVTIDAYDAHKYSWPLAVSAGLRALIDYLSSEPAHAHLSVVDTFAASPEALDIRQRALRAFAAYLRRGHELAEGVPSVAAEAIAGGIWQVLHHYIATGRIAELPALAPQISYFALTPFLGAEKAAETALRSPAAR